MMVSRRSAIFVTFLVLAACDGKQGGASPEHDMGPTGDGVSDTVPDVAAPVDAKDLGTELGPETFQADLDGGECVNHMNCGGGWYSCDDGVMNAAATGHIPCWGSLDCEEAGHSWPCLSGACGAVELCQDDLDFLAALIPDPAAWHPGEIHVLPTDAGEWGDWSCEGQPCTWEITGAGETVLRLGLPKTGYGESAELEGVTNLEALAFLASEVKELEVLDNPIEHDGVTLYWARNTYYEGYGWAVHTMGVSGGLSIDLPGGGRTVVAWIRDEGGDRYGLRTIDAAGQDCPPEKPHVVDGACVECSGDWDCPEELACTPENHRCEPADGTCGYCEAPYPVCAQIDGVWSCVQCKYDEDCPEGVECVPDLYFCNGGGEVFCPGCITDDDCQATLSDFQLECDVASGCCQDVTGLCDGVEGFCPNGECTGLWSDVLGCGVWPTSENEACEDIDPGMGLCTCSAPVDIEAPAGCPPPDFCAGGACPAEAVCVDAAVVELMFGASAPFDAGVCLPLEWIVNEL